MRRLVLMTCILFLGVSYLYPQASAKSTLSGKISGKDGEPLPFASISVEGKKLGTKCDEDGKYVLKNLSPGRYTIVATALGYQAQSRNIILKGDTVLNFSMIEMVQNLGEVAVSGKTETQKIREQPFTVTSIDLAPLKNLNLDMNTILNRTAGVRIRQMGGMGSDFSITLNGMSSLRIFIDGLPADGFGSSMSFNNFPVNIIERIDIYKGVTPVFLGGDVLGGAINIITKKENIKFIDLSYGYGSFNTHQAALSGRFISKKNFAFNVNGFFNHSDNDYDMLIKSRDSVTYVVKEIKIKRPHNAYTSAGLTTEAGFVKKPWADRLMIGGNISGNNNQLQGYDMTASPLMRAYQNEISLSPTLKYDKTNLFTKGLDVRFSTIYNLVQSKLFDTSTRSYSWDGTYQELPPLQGETGDKSLLKIRNHTFITTATVNYRVSDNHSFILNHNLNAYRRDAFDPYWKLSPPPNDIVNKQIGGLSYQLNLFENRWVTNIFFKAYYIRSKIHTRDTSSVIQIRENKTFIPGRGIATTYLIGDFQLKASYEFAATLPDAWQIIGDPPLLKPNPDLKPEESHNVNLGVLYNKQWGGNSLMVDINGFLRKPTNYIFLKSLGLNAQYQNIDVVDIKGFDGSMRYTFKDRFFVEASGSYQDMHHDQEFTKWGDPDPLYRNRIPNTPYLFGNINAGYFTKENGRSKWRAGVNWSTNYVDEFYLTWESQGDPRTKNVIPTQLSHDLSLTWSMLSSRYNLSISCLNIFNASIYDNFMVPRPGRAINAKVRMNINK